MVASEFVHLIMNAIERCRLFGAKRYRLSSKTIAHWRKGERTAGKGTEMLVGQKFTTRKFGVGSGLISLEMKRKVCLSAVRIARQGYWWLTTDID